MGCVALNSLMTTIEIEFLHPNRRVSLLLDDDEKALLKCVFEKLSCLEAFLKKEYSRDGAPARHLQIKITEFALKAEDDIEIQIRNILRLLPKLKDFGGGEGDHQQKADAHAHAYEGELYQTLQQLAKDADELLMMIINEEVEAGKNKDSLPLIQPNNEGGSLQCSPRFEEDISIVGRVRYLNTISRSFGYTYTNSQRRVISICGAPGIGKTTLCKEMYDDPIFSIRGWVTIPRRYNVQHLLCHLLQSMTPTPFNENEIAMLGRSTVSQLKRQLHFHLKFSTYLIVLDDVPNTMLWDHIQQCFPDDSNGSHILLTTLFTDVAEYVDSYIQPYLSLPFLTDMESMSLFFHRFSHKQQYQYMAPKFKEIAKHLVEECKGLPRSIVTVADRLSKCNYTLKEWRKIQKEFESLGTLHKDTQHLSKLTAIYNWLPQHLKLCFLYFAVFPKHSQIQMERLIKLWIAEGFVKPLRCLSLEDIAYKYLEDLINRELVRFDPENAFSPLTCSIHIDMHSFCVREAQKEGLLCAVNTRQCIGGSLDMLANSCRWLSLRSHSLDYHVLFSSNIPRSLLFFQGDFEIFIYFKHLRILEFSPSLVLKRVPLPPLGGLVFLRYLSVPQWFESLDDVVSTNSNLQTLIVSGINESTHGATLHLPSKIWELQHLRHLELGDMYTVDPPNMIKENLQTLVFAIPIHFRKQVYYHCSSFPSIRELKIVYKDVLVPGYGCSRGCCNGNPIIILENFEDLLMLESLTVIVPMGSITLLERLGFAAKLRELRLSGTHFPVKVLRVIGQLRKLKVLKLENAFYGRVWEVVEGEFCELQVLELEARSLERWVVNAINFPMLDSLFLKRCYSLEKIPLGLVKCPTDLRFIGLEQCPPCVVTSLKWIKKNITPYKYVSIPIYVDGKILP